MVNKSLVIMQEQEGEARYQMLETIRQYAREKLMMAGEGELIQVRHLAFFTQLAITAEPALDDTNQVVWLNRLEREHDNLRAGLSWALERNDRDSVLRLPVALGHFWFVRSHWSEGWRWLQRALEVSRRLENQTPEYRVLRRKGMRRAAAILLRLGDYEMVQVLAEESLVLSRELGDKRGMASSLEMSGVVAHNQGDYAAARMFHQEDLELKRESGSNYITIPLTNLGSVAYAQGDYVTARSFYQEALARYSDSGLKRGIAISLVNLGHLALIEGNYEAARAKYIESLILVSESGSKRTIADCWVGCANLAQATGQVERATRLCGAVSALLKSIAARLVSPEREMHEHTVTAVRAQLDEATFSKAWTEGQAMTIEQAIEYVLSTEIESENSQPPKA